MTDERMKEIRFLVWTLARNVILDAVAHPLLPGNTEEERKYACEFLSNIARATQPGGYRESDDDE